MMPIRRITEDDRNHYIYKYIYILKSLEFVLKFQEWSYIYI